MDMSKTPPNGFGSGSPRPSRTRPVAGPPKVDTSAPKEVQKPYSLLMAPSVRQRVDDIARSPMGYSSMNEFINQKYQELLRDLKK
jgi:hypothetical protein